MKQTIVTIDAISEWHTQIGTILKKAWEDNDLEPLRGKLAPNLRWSENSFEKPLTTPDEVIAQWQADLAKQRNVQVDIELLDSVTDRAYYLCKASWNQKQGKSRKIEGVLITRLNASGNIVEFSQWWTTAEIKHIESK